MPVSSAGRTPSVHPQAFVAPTATLVGDVVVEAGASIGYGALLRADLGRVPVRAGANVQDDSVLHGGDDPQTEIGPGATVAAPDLVPRRAVVPDGVLALGAPATVRGPLSEGATVRVDGNASSNRELARRHAAGVQQVGRAV